MIILTKNKKEFIRFLKSNRINLFDYFESGKLNDVYIFTIFTSTEKQFYKVATYANETLYQDNKHYNDIVTDSEIYLTWLTYYTTLFPNYNDYIKSLSYRYKKVN